mgnify:CR=1 FL=1
MADLTRGAGNGRFERTPDTAERDAQAASLRARGHSYSEIGEQLGYSKQAAWDAVQRALAAVPQEAGDAARQLELDRLDQMHANALAVLERKHVHVAGGKVVVQITEYVTDDHGNIVTDSDGNPLAAAVEPLEDDDPVLKAIDRLLKISERRSRLLGLDAPVKVSAEAQGLGAEIAALLSELGDGQHASD